MVTWVLSSASLSPIINNRPRLFLSYLPLYSDSIRKIPVKPE